ncbi:MAG: DUF1549 domain-containing protein, partial [Phycisphaerae bacterium]
MVVCAALSAASTVRAQEARPEPPVAATLRAFPSEVRLTDATDVERVIILHTDAAGVSHDVTSQAKLTASADGVVEYSAGGILAPKGDGTTTLTVAYQDLVCQIAVRVANTQQRRAASFRNDVEPVLMKAGCNAGSCHGNARGQDGFRLSLFGFDPRMDYLNLTRRNGARRLDVSDPAGSLMLQKGLAAVAHGGGQRFVGDSVSHDALTRWINAGAPDDRADLPQLVGIEILPDQIVLPCGAAQPFIVRARYSGGTDRDITPLALFASLNDVVADVSADGRVAVKDRGETFVMARFGTFAVVSQIIVVDDQPYTWPPEVRPLNHVDAAIHAKLRKLRILPSDVCDDSTFLRRACFDVIGLPPTAEEYRAFTGDERPDKRARLIDALLARPEFPELWAMKWAELLRIESVKLTVKGVQLYSDWLRDAIQRDVPIDRIAHELITASGGNFANPAANFYLVEQDPAPVAEN